jgi:hypothetical protein
MRIVAHFQRGIYFTPPVIVLSYAMAFRNLLFGLTGFAICNLPPTGLGQYAGGNIGVQQGLVVRQALDAAKRGPPIRPGAHGSFSMGATHIFPSDFEKVGDVSVSRWSAGAGVERVATNGTMFGFVFDHERSRYVFSDDSPASAEGIDDVTANRFGLNARRTLNEKWSLFGNVDTTFNVAEGANWGDGQTSGGLVSFSRRVNDKFSFSIGLVARSQLEERARVIPIPGIDWKITERLTLRTAQGVTLSWRIDERRKWIADFSTGYESRAFRLDEDGALPGGVVKDRRVPVTASLRYGPNPGLHARIFAGAVFAQQFEFLDSEGHTADTVDADPSLIAGVSGSIRF